MRREWIRYTVFAGTNTISEAKVALLALPGRLPLTHGPAIAEFERRFAEAVGTRYAFSFAAGRMALYVLLEALGIGPGDEVILPAFTCVVVPNAILYRGARPVYVDIEPRTFNIDVTQIEAKITSRTRAIIAQHTFGLVCDVNGIKKIAAEHNVAVLEDCAHALGATFQGQPAGSLGTAAFFSTDHTKIMSTGTGGMLTTNDKGLAETIASIYGRLPFLPAPQIRMTLAAFVAEVILFHPNVYILGKNLYSLLWRLGLRRGFFLDELNVTKPTAYPYPARLSNPQAEIGLSQLALLPKNLAWRRRLAKLYEAEVGAYAGLLEADYANHAFLRYTFMVEDRNAWQRYFDDMLDMRVWFTSVAHGRERELHEIGYRTGNCPMAEAAAAHCVNLPTHLRVSAPERLIHLLHQACNSGSAELKRHAAWGGSVSSGDVSVHGTRCVLER